VLFQTNYDEIELQKISYDIISVTPSLLCYRKNTTKLTAQDFFLLLPPPDPNQNFSATALIIMRMMKACKLTSLLIQKKHFVLNLHKF